MAHEAKNFDHLIGSVKGLSEKQLRAHFGLYQGYVKKLNEIEQKLQSADRSAANYSFGEFSELKRREAVAFNGTYLHELYFENLNGASTEASAALKEAINASFGSWDAWVTDVKASATSTPGWVLLTYNRRDGKLHNYIMFEHHIGLPVDQEILMALDCWEHAFMVDYATDKASYLKVFFENVDWSVVSGRLSRAAGHRAA
jgi:Fe-Mn family superoxide dismutase